MNLRQIWLALALAVVFAPAPGVSWAKEPAAQSEAAPTRPAEWGQPVKIDGVPNLNRVTANFYRSAQPTAIGFQSLAKDPGLKTVVSLRAFHSDKDLLEGTVITLVRVPMNAWHIETEDVVAALAAIRKAEANGGVLLHCQHGADRTGLITALYRVLYQGWTKDAALDEMRNGEFGYHAVWGNIPRYLRKANVAELTRMVASAGK